MDNILIKNFDPKQNIKGLLETLKEVWSVDELTDESLNEWLSNDNHMVIAELDGEIIGTATLHLQKKLIRNGGTAGFIEDVAVRNKFRGNNIGSLLIKELLKKAKTFNCYKVVLSCFPERVAFYERNGFFQESILMRLKQS